MAKPEDDEKDKEVLSDEAVVDGVLDEVEKDDDEEADPLMEMPDDEKAWE